LNKQALIDAVFKSLDTDLDNLISIDELKLNPKYSNLRFYFKDHDVNDDGKLDLLEFGNLFKTKSNNPNKKCTVVQEDETNYPERFSVCSSGKSCYVDGYKNDQCNEWESCALYVLDNGDRVGGCVLSKFCNGQGFLYGIPNFDI